MIPLNYPRAAVFSVPSRGRLIFPNCPAVLPSCRSGYAVQFFLPWPVGQLGRRIRTSILPCLRTQSDPTTQRPSWLFCSVPLRRPTGPPLVRGAQAARSNQDSPPARPARPARPDRIWDMWEESGVGGPTKVRAPATTSHCYQPTLLSIARCPQGRPKGVWRVTAWLV